METLIESTAPALEEELMSAAIEIGSFISSNIGDEENNRRLSRGSLDALKETGFLKLYSPMLKL
jgi:hypothetical protein